ncbi:MAG: MBL fold metallo-hydrolase [Planctomycetales bacterium]|nr:MBL fold metallo-hydrolase [Planctomycetales bacterium]
MQLTIHRGTQEIGGSCLEVVSGKTRLILDVGMPLLDRKGNSLDWMRLGQASKEELDSRGLIPPVSGLFSAGSPPAAIVLTHGHLDHTGLVDRTDPTIPIYATRGTSKMMLAGNLFARQVALPRERSRELTPRESVEIGAFRVTAFSVDHSIFGSAALLVEAEGQSLLYSGDLRLHGRKPGMATEIFASCGKREIDVLVMEGTHLGQPQDDQRTEYELEEQLVAEINSTSGLVLASFSPQHVDRTVSFIRAAIRTGRTFVADAYTAFVLHLVSSETRVPVPGKSPGYPVFFPKFLKRSKKRELLDRICPFMAEAEIRLEVILNDPQKYLMVFRPSMISSDFSGELPAECLCLYSRWYGYLEQPEWRDAVLHLDRVGGRLNEAHASGHIYVDDIRRFIAGVNPRVVIPVHSFAPHEIKQFDCNVQLLSDGMPLELE